MAQTERAKLIGSRLRKIREHYDWSAREFAEKIGIGMSTLQSYEWGRHEPRIGTIQAIEKLTGFSYDYITGASDYFGDNAPIKGDYFIATYVEIKVIKRLKAFRSLAELTGINNIERIVKVHIPPNTDGQNVVGITQTDSSMDSGKDPVRKGSILILDVTAEVNIGSLVVVKIKDQPQITRKVVNINNKEITLAANDPAFGTITVPRENVEALVRVVKSEFHQEH